MAPMHDPRVPDIDSFEAVMTRADRAKAVFVGFDYSDDALREIDAFFRKSGKVIVALTVCEVLEEQLARKLAQTSPSGYGPPSPSPAYYGAGLVGDARATTARRIEKAVSNTPTVKWLAWGGPPR
jgi:hypothetical protein